MTIGPIQGFVIGFPDSFLRVCVVGVQLPADRIRQHIQDCAQPGPLATAKPIGLDQVNRAFTDCLVIAMRLVAFAQGEHPSPSVRELQRSPTSRTSTGSIR